MEKRTARAEVSSAYRTEQEESIRANSEIEPWFIITNIESLSEVLKVYRARADIEAMFKDCQTGGYNLEGSKANNKRLQTLILLIAIAYTATSLTYTATSLKGQTFRQTNQAK